MKVLITNTHLTLPHGSEIWTAVIANELWRRGHEVYLWSPEIGPFHSHCLLKFPTISPWQDHYAAEPPTWMQAGFDIAILQHLNVIQENETWEKGIKVSLPPPDKIIAISHGIAVSPETPVKADFLDGARYTCISEEIANHYPDFDWNVINQPIDPSWFELKTKERGERSENVEKIVWASHRVALPEPLREICVRDIIGVYAAGNRAIYPEQVQAIYSQVDLVFGTGRWIYEAIAAGIPCIVADSSRTLGPVHIGNLTWFQENNMTLRHSSAVDADWMSLLKGYNSMHSTSSREYALQNFHVSKVVDNLLASIGFESMGNVINKVYS